VASSPIAKALERSIRVLQRAEDALLVLLLGATVLLAPLQIALRGVFGTGIAWIDPLLRVMVLWLGLLGALAASRDGRLITIDVASRILPRRPRAAAGAVTSLFTAGVSGIVAYHAARFVASELRFGSVAFSGIPAWVLESVLPFAFGAIALRYLLRFASELGELFSREQRAT
jgi:TRAP-type C4-dicarboxylate transport system permease small subunit